MWEHFRDLLKTDKYELSGKKFKRWLTESNHGKLLVLVLL